MTALSETAQILLATLPDDGRMVTNAVAMQHSQLDYESYTQAKNELRGRGSIEIGRGRGGTIGVKKPMLTAKREQGVSLEKDLYESVETYFEDRWKNDHEPTDDVFTIISANQKGPKKKGLWTVPDVTLLGIAKYEFLPLKVLELTTVEVKTTKNVDPSGVFEAASHHKYAHKAYLAYERLRQVDPNAIDFQRLKDEARRFGVGLVEMVRSTDGDRWEYQELSEAQYQEPDPGVCNAFIEDTLRRYHKEIRLAL